MSIKKNKTTLIFTVIVVTCVLCSMLSTALTTALPGILVDFRISAAQGQWLTSIYSLVMGIMVLCTAYLIKRFRTRPLYLVSLGIFTMGIVLDALTNSFVILMLGRVLQAVGNGILFALGQVIILTIFPREKTGSVMGIYGLAGGAAPIIAPTLAGIIVDLAGWRMIFYLLFVICIVAFGVTWLCFEDLLEREQVQLDFRSVLYCMAGFGGLLLGIGNIGSYSLVDFRVWGVVLIGILCNILFTRRQLRLEVPFLNLRVLENKKFRIALFASCLLYFNMMALAVMNPLYVQKACNYSATLSGLLMMPGSIIMALVSPHMGKKYDREGIRKLFFCGSFLLTIGTFGVGVCNQNMILFVAFNILGSVAIAMLMMPLMTWGVSELKARDIAAGSSLITSLRTIAGAFGSAFFGAVEVQLEKLFLIHIAMSIAFVSLASISVLEIILAIIVLRETNRNNLIEK